MVIILIVFVSIVSANVTMRFLPVSVPIVTLHFRFYVYEPLNLVQ